MAEAILDLQSESKGKPKPEWANINYSI
jgi:hypothetical protein